MFVVVGAMDKIDNAKRAPNRPPKRKVINGNKTNINIKAMKLILILQNCNILLIIEKSQAYILKCWPQKKLLQGQPLC